MLALLLVFICALLENLCCFPTVLSSWVNYECACYDFKPSPVIIISGWHLFITKTSTLTLSLVQCFREPFILERDPAMRCLHNQNILGSSNSPLSLKNHFFIFTSYIFTRIIHYSVPILYITVVLLYILFYIPDLKISSSYKYRSARFQLCHVIEDKRFNGLIVSSKAWDLMYSKNV